MPGKSIHARLNESKSFSAIASVIDSILEPAPASSAMQAEIISPLLLVAQQIEALRTGTLGQLSGEQREALNLAHGRLSQVVTTLREMEAATSAAAEMTLAGAPVLAGR
ncbi:MAG TPA: hypothetical protein VF137_02755 [Candidatus Dormibacteraeota bacterium]